MVYCSADLEPRHSPGTGTPGSSLREVRRRLLHMQSPSSPHWSKSLLTWAEQALSLNRTLLTTLTATKRMFLMLPPYFLMAPGSPLTIGLSTEVKQTAPLTWIGQCFTSSTGSLGFKT